MGQGLNTKIRQIVAAEFAVPLESVRVMPTSTEKNNNTSPTAASASTDLNGTAALRACRDLEGPARRGGCAAFRSTDDGIEASPDAHPLRASGRERRPHGPGSGSSFASSSGWPTRSASTWAPRLLRHAGRRLQSRDRARQPVPVLHQWRRRFRSGDRSADRRARGDTRRYPDGPRPIAQSGHRPRPGDRRLRPGDGLGDDARSCCTPKRASCCRNSPNNYKIPGVECIPAHFRVDFLEDSDNPINLLGSKAVGEPPFVLGISVGMAAKSGDFASLSPGRSPALAFPATSEELLKHLAASMRPGPLNDIVPETDEGAKSVSEPRSEEEFMALAIAKARDGIAAGQSPFGAIIVRGQDVVAATHNTVWRDTDPTAHAEVNCIRSAARSLKLIDLSGCEMYSTCEPCPMCLAAIHWAKIDRVVYGATIADAAAAGFCELHVDAKLLAEMGKSPLKVESGLLREECAQLFELWQKTGLCGTY